jgi:hypothetical protein
MEPVVMCVAYNLLLLLLVVVVVVVVMMEAVAMGVGVMVR